MDLMLKDKRVLVTASSGGIGQEIARTFAAEGAEVIVNGRSQESVDSAIQSIRQSLPDAKLSGLVADNGTKEGCDKTIAEYPDVDVLVNNLGIYEAADFFEISDEEWERFYEVNVLSGVRLSRHYLKKMLDRGTGRVIFVSSESGMNPTPEMAHYGMTKTAQLAISRSLAELTKGTAVTVNSVLPGPTRTDSVEALIQNVIPESDPEVAEKRFLAENRPSTLLQRLIKPEEIASVVAFTASERAAAINGATVRADGGVVRLVF
ncbi:SDR family NAD(P)-dependent oxidoreductase [Rubinisphaera sp. JC750]|uniref:SDR family NAD(P)-dependent oxidoreductase n=1 Tax=Rubinisphaera sp. JC750 TaxID=2898658 RepID=UPI001F3711E9|nr:SDR family oxidoreductase [Rubinisphaera sp. JC750]